MSVFTSLNKAYFILMYMDIWNTQVSLWFHSLSLYLENMQLLYEHVNLSDHKSEHENVAAEYICTNVSIQVILVFYIFGF